jgi:hypothetical protein
MTVRTQAEADGQLLGRIRATDWAKRFKRNAPSSFEEALSIAAAPRLPVILKWNEDTGERLCSVSPIANPDFWLDAFPTAKEAIQLCREMDWRITRREGKARRQ